METKGELLPLKTKKIIEKSIKKMSSVEPCGQSVLQKVPSTVNVAQILAKLETEKSIQRLAYLRDNAQNESVQRGCANDILNRAWGMPAQSIQVTSDVSSDLSPIVLEVTDLLIKAQSYLDQPIETWPEDVKNYFKVED